MYQIEVSLVFLSVLQENENVVDVYPYKNPQLVSKNVIYDKLECPWCIAEARGHNNPFEGSKLRVEGGFFDIFVMDSNLVEPTDKIYLREDGGTPQCVQYGLDRRQGVSISNSSGIQGSLADIRHFPFAFLTSRQPAQYGLEDGRIWPD